MSSKWGGVRGRVGEQRAWWKPERERESEGEFTFKKKNEKKMETELQEEGRRDKICKRGVKKKQRGRGRIQTSTTSV